MNLSSKLFTLLAVLTLLIGGIITPSAKASSHSETHKKDSTSCCQKQTASKKSNGYWYIGAGVTSPFLFDDLYSWTDKGIHWGIGGRLKGGYRFNPNFGLELSVAYGRNTMSPSSYQKDYILGLKDAYTYYPYMVLNGVQVDMPAQDVFGYLGKNNKALPDAKIDGVGFDKIESQVEYLQLSINPVFNLTRLFKLEAARCEQPIEWLLAPGAYLSHFRSTVSTKADYTNLRTGEVLQKSSQVAPRVNQDLTWGLGGYTTVRFNLSDRFALDLTNTLVWEYDHTIDGITSAKRAYDSWIWVPEVSLVVNFGKKSKCGSHCATPTIVPIKIEEAPSYPTFEYTYPKPVMEREPKERTRATQVQLIYPINKTHIVPMLANNTDELIRVTKELGEYAKDPDLKLKNIIVEGFASPEGPLDNNLHLAQKRAETLIAYIVENSDLRREMMEIGEMTENWEGLHALLTSTAPITNKEELLTAFNAVGDTEARKSALKKIEGYKELVKEFYPRLRFSRLVATYEVKVYTPQEAKEAYKKDASRLSPKELYALAHATGIETTVGQEIIATLQLLYPRSEEALICKAIHDLRTDNITEAAACLKLLHTSNAEITNLKGVVEAKRKEWAKAAELFRAAKGNKEAVKNLEKLAPYTKN